MREVSICSSPEEMTRKLSDKPVFSVLDCELSNFRIVAIPLVSEAAKL